MLILSPTVVSQHLSKSDKRVGGQDDRHGLSPILYDTAPIFIYTDQLFCHCVFIGAPIFANGWFTACDGFYGASAYWLSHMKQ